MQQQISFGGSSMDGSGWTFINKEKVIEIAPIYKREIIAAFSKDEDLRQNIQSLTGYTDATMDGLLKRFKQLKFT